MKIIQNGKVTLTNSQRMTKRTTKPKPMKRILVTQVDLKTCLFKMRTMARLITEGWSIHPGIEIRVEHQGNKIRIFNNVGHRLLLIPNVVPGIYA